MAAIGARCSRPKINADHAYLTTDTFAPSNKVRPERSNISESGIMRFAPERIASRDSRVTGREADVSIKPEEETCKNWTKVSIDTIV